MIIIIFIALFSSNFIIILLQQQPAYSQEDTTTPAAESQPSLTNEQWFGIFLLIIAIVLTVNELRSRQGKRRVRRSFPQSVREDMIRKQHHKCAICQRHTSIWDFDHKDGNRSNNNPSNCQALCPTCHAKKTRGLLKQEKKFHLSWRVIVAIILFLIFLHLIRVI
jgi:hypothetical protein